MMRLEGPRYSFEQAIDECILGVTGNDSLRQSLMDSKNNINGQGVEYLRAASAGELYVIPSLNTVGDDDPLVVDALKKSDLVKIYEQYFRAEKKPARKIYDSLLNAAKDKCPFCGGIGSPRNLDHFLPKAHYPQFSILPRNLVPSCRDCNMDGKGHGFAESAGDQIIQPYSDNDRFFMEQWIFAEYEWANDGSPGTFEYYVSPPGGWSDVDKKRVGKHFEDFDLARRYAIKAAEHVGVVLRQIDSLERAGLDAAIIEDCVLQPGVDSAQFPNHWQKGMYQALIRCYRGGE